MSRPLLPGAVLGVLGGGQLGRMFACAAARMGYRVAVYTDVEHSPAGAVAAMEMVAAYDDRDALETFARSIDVLTFEFENVPVAAADAAARHAPVRPAGSVLHTTQDRLREKRALRHLGLPVADFWSVEDDAGLAAARAAMTGPGVLKTTAWGYDGKGQRRVDDADALAAAWRDLGRAPAVLETFIEFEREISVVGARGLDGGIALYEPFENAHAHHILDVTLTPARIPGPVRDAAHEIARTVLSGLEVVGVLCIEMFVLPGGGLVVNELAPRTHNSGHVTIDAHTTSQFEQQVRAICGLPLGSVEPLAPAGAMANLLGDLWTGGTPRWEKVLAEPGLHLHLYGKAEARPGRKMGHLTAIGDSVDRVGDRVRQGRELLRP